MKEAEIHGVLFFLGVAASFTIFGITFTSGSQDYRIDALLGLQAVGSALVGRRYNKWIQMALYYSVGYGVLFLIFIQGSVEAGVWRGNLTLMIWITLSIFFPAMVSNRLSEYLRLRSK